MGFKDYLTESKDKISDLTGANKSISRKENNSKFFTLREWNDEEKADTAYAWAIKQGKYKWDIVDNIKPDYKTSFPVAEMRAYSDRTVQINVKYALQDIAKGKWNPDV